MKKYFLRLFQYNAWANQRVIQNLVDQKVSQEKAISLVGHIAAAEMVWIHRIKLLPKPDVKLWSNYSLDELSKMVTAADKDWLDYIQSNDQFDYDLNYSNLSGEPFTSNVESIILHVANHGSYHRAQVAMQLRQNGFEPVNTDFITYDREMSSMIR